MKSVAAWPLVIICAALPLMATHLAWVISINEGYVPSCIPYFEGCTSISRAARHGLANHIFRFVMLPTTLLQLLLWLTYREFLKTKDPSQSAGRALPTLGAIAAVFLGLYVTFLGTDGEVYQFLRRSGVAFYFGMNYLAQLIVHYHMALVTDSSKRLPKTMLSICALLLPLAILTTYITATTQDPRLKDQLENIIEWNLSLLIMIWILLFGFLWKELDIRIEIRGPRACS